MIEIQMVCEECEYDFFGEDQFIDSLDDDVCNDHICNDEWAQSKRVTRIIRSNHKGYTKNTVFKEEIEKYIKKQFNIKESK